MESLIGDLVSHGPIGLLAAIAIWAYWKKDKQASALYRRLESRAEQMVDRYHTLGTETNETLKALIDSLERSKP